MSQSRAYSSTNKDYKRRKFVGRFSFSSESSDRLETPHYSSKKDFLQVGLARCGSFCNRSIRPGASLLHLEHRGRIRQGSRLSSTRFGLEPTQTTICLPTIQSSVPDSTEGLGPEGRQDDPSLSLLALETLFHGVVQDFVTNVQNSIPEEHDNRPGIRAPSTEPGEDESSRITGFWQSLDRAGHNSTNLSETSKKLVSKAWRDNTDQEYSYQWNRWTEYCEKQGIQTLAPTLEEYANFLSYLFDQGYQYNTINVARSALSSTLAPMDGLPMGQHVIISKLMKGIFNERPIKKSLFPKWDLNTVLLHIKTWGPSSGLDLKYLSYKMIFILAMVCSKRPSTLALFTIDDAVCQISNSTVRLLPVGLEKHSRPEFIKKPVVIQGFPDDPLLDPVPLIKFYIEKTSSIRTSNSLMIDFKPPHGKVSSRGLSSWMKRLISESGQLGTSGSSRSASVSKLFNAGFSLESIMEAGDWTQSTTFLKYYFEPALNISAAVLNVNV